MRDKNLSYKKDIAVNTIEHGYYLKLISIFLTIRIKTDNESFSRFSTMYTTDHSTLEILRFLTIKKLNYNLTLIDLS